MTFRRTILKSIAGVVPFTLLGSSAGCSQKESQTVPAPSNRDYFKELGVTPFINAAGAYSAYGGARMRPEVIDAMRYAATRKVKMADLHTAVGKKIAMLAGSEAAMVTSGATASLVVGTAACMTLGDEHKMQQLPDTTFIKNEIIIQKKHRYTYDRALTVAGGKLIEVESEQDVRNSVNERTAMMFFLKPTQQGDNIAAKDYISLAKELGVPCFCDAATTTPPANNILKGIKQGFDLICYSGGKGLRGPYSAGLLLGKADLVSYARRHSAPNHLSIGRGMKVSSEEYLGMLIALETSLNVSEAQDYLYKQQRFENIIAQISDIKGVITRIFESESITNELYLDIDWDTKLIQLSREEFIAALRNHSPSVEIRLLQFSGGRIQLSATVMAEGQDVIVGRIIRKVLSSRSYQVKVVQDE